MLKEVKKDKAGFIKAKTKELMAWSYSNNTWSWDWNYW